MHALSKDCHKALLPIGGTTILGRIMDALLDVGIDRVTVVTGYRASDVESFLRKNHQKADVKFVHNPRYEDTNNIVSLSIALDELAFDADVVLIECDLLFDSSLLSRLIENPGRNVALVDQYRTGMDGTVVDLTDGFISAVYPADQQDANFSYSGKFKTLNIYRFDREFCRSTLQPVVNTYANQVDSSCYYELVLGMLSNIPAHRINAEVVSGERWVEVDDPNDLAAASFRFETERRSGVLERAFGGHWNFDILDFSFMRNAYFPNGAMLAAMKHGLGDLMKNYGSSQPVLNEKLAYMLNCDPRHVETLHGASQAFPILRALLTGRRIAIPTPTFGEYPRMFLDAERYADVPGVDPQDLTSVAESSDVVVVVNPNSPTGTLRRSSDLYALARSRPETLFLIDESFIAFSDETSILGLVESDPLDNVLVLTSLSKCLGVPGVRVGYLYSTNTVWLENVAAELPTWNLGSLGEFLLELMLKFSPSYALSLEHTKRDREALARNLSELPIVTRTYPSGGNFLLTELAGGPSTAAMVREWLLETHSIEVKDVTGRIPDDVPRLRIGVRLPEENAQLVRALHDAPRVWAVDAGIGS